MLMKRSFRVFFQIFITYTWVVCAALFLCESKSAGNSTRVVFRKASNVFVYKARSYTL